MTVEETPVAVAAVKKGSVPRPDETAFNKVLSLSYKFQGYSEAHLLCMHKDGCRLDGQDY